MGRLGQGMVKKQQYGAITVIPFIYNSNSETFYYYLRNLTMIRIELTVYFFNEQVGQGFGNVINCHKTTDWQ